MRRYLILSILSGILTVSVVIGIKAYNENQAAQAAEPIVIRLENATIAVEVFKEGIVCVPFFKFVAVGTDFETEGIVITKYKAFPSSIEVNEYIDDAIEVHILEVGTYSTTTCVDETLSPGAWLPNDPNKLGFLAE